MNHFIRIHIFLPLVIFQLLGFPLLSGAVTTYTCSTTYGGDAVLNEVYVQSPRFIEIAFLEDNVNINSWLLCYSKNVNGGNATCEYLSGTYDKGEYLTVDAGSNLNPDRGEVFLVAWEGNQHRAIDYFRYGSGNVCSDDTNFRWDVSGSCGSCLNTHTSDNKDIARLPDSTGSWQDNERNATKGESNGNGGVPPGFHECYFDDFNRNNLGEDWRIIKQDNYTPEISSNRLRITRTRGSISAGVVLEGDFPADDNYSEFVFELRAYQYRSGQLYNGADGVVLVLSNAAVAPIAGAFGGSLGYANRNGHDGFAGGWLGFGFDEYGNFSNHNEGRHGGPGFRRDAVAVRGHGSEETGYEYITGTGTLSVDIDRNPNGHMYKVSVDTRNNKTLIKVERDTGSGYTSIIDWYDATQLATAPTSFRISLTGSTGGSVNYHEIDNFRFSALHCGSVGEGVDHYRIYHDGSALTCANETVTIKACANADCSALYTGSTTITLNPAFGWVQSSYMDENRFTFTGQGSAQLQHATPENVVLGITDQGTGYICNDATNSAADCTITYHDSGFIFPVNPANSIDKHIVTSCESKNIAIEAVRKDPATEKCVPAFTNVDGDVDVGFSFDYVNPTSGTMDVNMNGTSLDTGSYTDVTLNFNNQGESSFAFQYSDAGEVQLNARMQVQLEDKQTLTMVGNTRMIVHPAGLCVYTDDANNECVSGDPNNGTCTPFVAAGTPFNLKVKGVCGESGDVSDTDFCEGAGNTTTPNFQTNMGVSHNLIAPAAADGGVPGSIAVTSLQPSDMSSGEYRVQQIVSEVGVFTFTADPPNDYLGAGDVFGGATFTSANIGRFIPDHFTVTVLPDPPEFKDQCNGLFTYLGQPFDWDVVPDVTITAMNGAATPVVTTNYEGAFWKLNNQIDYGYTDHSGASVANTLSPATGQKSLGSVSDINGTASFSLLEASGFNYTRPLPTSPVNLFNPLITYTIQAAELTDSDGVCYENGGACSSFTKAGISGVSIRHGRTMVFDNFGPELEDIERSPFETQYWNDTSWVTNSDDDCTSPIVFDTVRATVTSSPEISQGLGQLTVTSDGTTTPVQVNGLTPSWLYCPPNSECTGVFTFGISRGNDRIINWKEISR